MGVKFKGPFHDRGRWRIRFVDTATGKTTSHAFATENEANKAIPKLIRSYQRPVGVVVENAVTAYRSHLEAKGLKTRTIDVALERVGCIFREQAVLTGELTKDLARANWIRYATRLTRGGKLPSVDSQIGVLKAARSFLAWCQTKGWLKVTDLLADIEILGKRRKGKPQLTEDQSKRFLTVALERGRAGDEGAVAAATCLLLGLRASEVANRLVADLDANGTKLLITSAKTQAGIRTLKVPDVLQPLLQLQAKGKPDTAKLFGLANRHWVLRSVQRLCKLAGVPVVPAHGLRGTHARLAVRAGMTGEAVAASLGHESFAVTEQHYAGSEVVAEAAAGRVARALNETVGSRGVHT